MRMCARIALGTILLVLGSRAVLADELPAAPQEEEEEARGEDDSGSEADSEAGDASGADGDAGGLAPIAPVVTPAAADVLAKARIVFARGAALLAISASGKGEPTELMRLVRAPAASTVAAAAVAGGPAGDARQALAITRIAPDSRPAMVLVETGERTLWANLQAGAASAAEPLECAGRAHVTPDGRYVACTDGRGRLLVHWVQWPARGQAAAPGKAAARRGGTQVGKRLRTFVLAAPPGPPLGFDGSHRLIVRDSDGLWGVPFQRSGERALLAPHAPDSAVLVAPSGELAAGVYAEKNGASTALYVVHLDGKGVRRRLMKSAVPVAWSHDSRWLLIQQDERVCLVRAVGGEYKCWSGYRGVALAPDGSYALLVKPAGGAREGQPALDLYKGRRDGVRPEPPTLLVRGVDGPAAWLPSLE